MVPLCQCQSLLQDTVDIEEEIVYLYQYQCLVQAPVDMKMEGKVVELEEEWFHET